MKARIEIPVPSALAEVVAPLGVDQPCGENVRRVSRHQEKYYRLKDTRNAARAAERTGPSADQPHVTALWREVDSLAVGILGADTKDIEILAWLTEAQLRVRGFEGLRDAFAATTSLLDDYWNDIHSIGDDDDMAEKLAPFAGLNGINSEGSLVQAIRLTSLVPNEIFAHHSLWDYQLAQRANEGERRESLYAAAGTVGATAMAAHLRVVTECLTAFAELTGILSKRCGAQAPPSSATTRVLQDVAFAIRDIAGLNEEAAPAVDMKPGQSTEVTPPSITSREEAFELLLGAARYFRRSEPHSPISLAIETLVRRGRMDFAELLGELLPDANARNAVLTAAGIKIRAEK